MASQLVCSQQEQGGDCPSVLGAGGADLECCVLSPSLQERMCPEKGSCEETGAQVLWGVAEGTRNV